MRTLFVSPQYVWQKQSPAPSVLADEKQQVTKADKVAAKDKGSNLPTAVDPDDLMIEKLLAARSGQPKQVVLVEDENTAGEQDELDFQSNQSLERAYSEAFGNVNIQRPPAAMPQPVISNSGLAGKTLGGGDRVGVGPTLQVAVNSLKGRPQVDLSTLSPAASVTSVSSASANVKVSDTAAPSANAETQTTVSPVPATTSPAPQTGSESTSDAASFLAAANPGSTPTSTQPTQLETPKETNSVAAPAAPAIDALQQQMQQGREATKAAADEINQVYNQAHAAASQEVIPQTTKKEERFIYGLAVDHSENPVAGATVSVLDANNQVVAPTTTTGTDGRFALQSTDLPFGGYVIHLEHPQFKFYDFKINYEAGKLPAYKFRAQ